MKRKLIVLMAIMFAAVTASAYDFESKGIYYNILSADSKTVAVTNGDNNYSGDIIIGASVENNGVTYAVEEIGDYAFAGCSALSSVSLPDGIKVLGLGCFSGCTELQTISIPASVKDIRDRSFSACSALKEIDLPSSLLSMGNYCLSGCVELEKISLPLGVVTLGEYCFHGCAKLKEMELPSSVSTIGNYCFNGCISLEKLMLSSGLTSLPSYFISECKQLKEITIPETVWMLEDCCFGGCYIENLVVPNTVMDVAGNFLDKNPNIKRVELNVDLSYVPSYYAVGVGNHGLIVGCFFDCSALETVIINSPVTSLPQYCFKECLALNTVRLPETLTEIGDCCFLNCFSLTDLEIPSSVKRVGGACFFNCKAIKNIVIPDGVTELPYVNEVYYYNYSDSYRQSYLGSGGCFYGCESLENVSIPSSVTSMGQSSFTGCSSLKNISLPFSVTTLGDNFFSGCNSLAAINIPSSITSLGSGCFKCCESLKEINIPASVTEIGESCFTACISLEKVKMPSSITELKKYTFSACWALKQIELPSSITEIGNSVFSDCKSLESIVIPKYVNKIGSACFSKCSSLKFVYIPETVSELNYGGYCHLSEEYGLCETYGGNLGGFFAGCSSLEEIELPASITKVDKYCFAECFNLKTLICKAESVPETGIDIFTNTLYNSVGCLYVPSACVSAYKSAEQWGDWCHISAIGGGEIEIKQCEKPIITILEGKLRVKSETDGSNCQTTITTDDVKIVDGEEIIELSGVYKISSYAYAEGYLNSETVSALLVWVNPSIYDPNGILSMEAKKAIVIKSINGQVVVCGTECGERVGLFTLDGLELVSVSASDGETVLPCNLQKGEIVIVRYGYKAVKIKL